MIRWIEKLLVSNFIIVCILCFIPLSAVSAQSGPTWTTVDTANNGAACMHGDISSSDTTSLPGPGVEDVQVTEQLYLSACPTVLIRSDGNPFALCTNMLGRNPVARLLRQADGREYANLNLDAGSLLGGVYAYLDGEDRLVMVDGNQRLIRIKAQKKNVWLRSRWALSIDASVSLSSAVTEHCGGDACDSVVSISPGADGTVWFVTQQGVVGIYRPDSPTQAQAVATLKLGVDERIDNSFSSTGDGRAAVVTSKALYLVRQDEEKRPQIAWRYEYDAGSARKPGQLSHGSGATPTFFGPYRGSEYVTITDNADDKISVIVLNTRNGDVICKKRIFEARDNSGTENSAIGLDDTVIVASTYGYPYPELPEGAGPSEPRNADFVGGIVSVDCKTCEVLWENSVRSAAVPKLSTADRLIYTIERRSALGADKTSVTDTYHFTAIDFFTGKVLRDSPLGTFLFPNTLQMAGNIGFNKVFWQGNMGGIVRIAPQR